MNDNWQSCPRCGSNKVIKGGQSAIVLLGIGGIAFGFALLMFFPLIGILSILMGVVYLVISAFVKPTWFCQDCKNSWRRKEVKVGN